MNRWLPRPLRSAARVSAALLLASTPALLAAPAAHADPLVMVCTGTGLQTYTPGITLTTHETVVTNTSDLTTCLGGPVSSGHHSFGPFTTTASCLYTPPTGPDAFDLTWNDNTTSHYEGTYVVTTTAGQLIVTSTGTITAGRFTGKTLQEVVTYLAPNLLQCATPRASPASRAPSASSSPAEHTRRRPLPDGAAPVTRRPVDQDARLIPRLPGEEPRVGADDTFGC